MMKRMIVFLGVLFLAVSPVFAELKDEDVQMYSMKFYQKQPVDESAKIIQEAFSKCDFRKSNERMNLKWILLARKTQNVAFPMFGKEEEAWLYGIASSKLEEAIWTAYGELVSVVVKGGTVKIEEDEIKQIEKEKQNARTAQLQYQQLIHNQRMIRQMQQMNQMW